jgi:hypothetical protein
MQIYYCAFIIRIYDLAFSFLPLYWTKRDTFATLTTFNHKGVSRNVPNSMTFTIKSSHQNFIIFLNKVQAAIIGYKSCDFLATLHQLDPDTLSEAEFGCLTSTFSSTISFAWEVLPKGLASGLCPNGLFCIVYHSTSGHQ